MPATSSSPFSSAPFSSTPLSRRGVLGAAGGLTLGGVVLGAVPAGAATPAESAAPAAARIRFRKTILGPAYADMYPTDVVADSTYYYVNDNGRYRLCAVNRATGVIDYERYKARVPGLDDVSGGRGMGMDAEGNLYVADTLNNRIYKMTKKFKDILDFGGKGDGPGQFKGITDVAVGPGLDASGAPTEVVYVTDKAAHMNNTRINKFTTDGEYLGVIGEDEHLHFGQLVVDPVSHNLFVCEAITQGFVIYNEKGKLLKRVGGRGSGDGQFKGLPRGIDVAGKKVFVTDSDNRRIQVFSTNGQFLYAFGSRGTGLGQFIGPKGVVVSQGKVLVCDLYGYGLDEFTIDGTPIRSLFGGVPPLNGVNRPRGLDIDNNNKLNVIDWWRQSIIRCNLDGSNPEQVGQTGDRDQPGALTFPTDVRIQKGTGIIYVANRESDEVEVLDHDGTSHLDAQFGSKDLHHPVGLAFTPAGDVVVTDSPQKRLMRFTLDSKGSGTLAETLTADSIGGLKYCNGVDVAPDGTIWVGDNLGVVKYAKGVWTRFTSVGAGLPDFRNVWGVRVGPDGLVYVTDGGNNRVVVIDASGALVASTTVGDTFDGKPLYDPQGIDVSKNGVIIVSDTGNDRVITFVLA